ncbi:growth arrest-specific protein 1 homolog [Clytia hemisphaerica]|uniref:Uncharacterized protein n=1 Tax=Clytia hemisphaerica TaxID=252671 RepID=A0A7M5WKR6_9CNID|eukprot:TCONS_00022827-protein
MMMEIKRWLRFVLLVLMLVYARGYNMEIKGYNKEMNNSDNEDDPCNNAMNECLAEAKCRKKLQRLRDTCKDLFSNFNYMSSESSKISCSPQCRRRLINAKKHYQLKTLLTCKTKKSYFFPYQERAERCIAGKIDAKVHENFVQDGCSNVFQDCMKFHRCRKRYQRMMFECSEMVNGQKCTTTCEKSLKKFLVSQHISGFYQCRCDGAIYFQQTCHSLKQNILNLCVSNQFKGFLSKRELLLIK